MDIDALIDNDPVFQSGEIALWLAITIDAFTILRDAYSHQDRARDWIGGPEIL